MDRYKFTKKKKSSTNNRVLQSTIYPKIDISDGDLFVISKNGDRLDNLAYKYYKDISLWWVIAQANNLRNGKFTVVGGLQLRIPMEIPKILKDLEILNK